MKRKTIKLKRESFGIIEWYNDEVINAMENANYEENHKAYWSKDVAELLEISTSNLRRWSMDLEKGGYRFYRDEHNRRAYLEKDIMPLKKLKEFLSNNMSKSDAIKAVISMFPQNDNEVFTLPVNEETVRLSKRELEEIVQSAVKVAIEDEREAMFKVFEHKMNDTFEKRDRFLTQQLRNTLEEQSLQIAAAREKKWWRFWSK
jgi:DNA-binding transcriptional MerR regulator